MMKVIYVHIPNRFEGLFLMLNLVRNKREIKFHLNIILPSIFNVCIRDTFTINQTNYITTFFICFDANVLSVSHHDSIAYRMNFK